MSATRDLLTSGVPGTRDVPFDEDALSMRACTCGTTTGNHKPGCPEF